MTDAHSREQFDEAALRLTELIAWGDLRQDHLFCVHLCQALDHLEKQRGIASRSAT